MKWLFLLLVLTGCSEERTGSSIVNDTVLLNARCTSEQYTQVEKQTIFCIEHTGYRNTFCYQAAFERNCPAAIAQGGK